MDATASDPRGEDGSRPSSATHLLSPGHGSDEEIDEYRDEEGQCCFCGVEMEGVPADDVISEKYFTDNDLAVARTGHVCAHCAYCMRTRELKQGHWIATQEKYRPISTGQLRHEFDVLQSGTIDPPVALHVSADPIRSEHAYLWTPVAHCIYPLVVDYDGQRVRIEWDTYEKLVLAVEELRWHGFRGDDIHSGEPRVRDLDAIGLDRYRELDELIESYRGTALLDLVWTVSQSKSDQQSPPPEIPV